MWRDIVYAVRGMYSRRVFTAVTILSLAMGIGSNTAVFSVVNTVLLKPLKVPDADRLGRVSLSYPGYPTSDRATLPHFNILRDRADIFEDISAHRLDFVNVTDPSSSAQLPVARVTASFFRVFGALLLSGRTFTPDEDGPNGEHVAVVSYGFWKRFGGDGNVLGKTISLGGQPYVIVGILNPSFDTEQFDQVPDIWIPLKIDYETKDVGGEFCVITARLKAGTTFQSVMAPLSTATADYQKQFPNRAITGGTFGIIPLKQAMVANARSSLIILFVTVILVLFIACANVSNLLLIQGTGRKREMAIRVALGATRGRLGRQLLTESAVLSLVGGVLGLVLGLLGVRLLLALYPENNPLIIANNTGAIPRVGSTGGSLAIDWHVLLFTAVVSITTALLFGLLPAMKMSRSDTSGSLRHAGAAFGTRSRQKTQTLLIVAEVAMALTLLISAALLIRTSIVLHFIHPGFDASNVLTLRMSVTGTPFEKRAGIEELTNIGLQQIRTLPGVIAASSTCCVPLETVWQLPFRIVGREPGRLSRGFGGWTFISPGYFDVFKIPLLRGRDFTARDNASSQGVAIINETMARLFWPSGDPLNDSLMIGRGVRPDYEEDPIRRIIGIVGDVRDVDLKKGPRPEVYVPVAQVPDAVTVLNVRLLPLTWIVRTRVPPYSLRIAVEKELKESSRGLPIGRVRSMDEVLAESTARVRFTMWLMTIFGGFALILAVIGVYGLMTYSVQQRTKEFGVCMALGATPHRLRNDAILKGMTLALAGVVVGLAGAFLLTRFLESFIFGVDAKDLIAFLTASILLTCAAFIAVWIPAQYAISIDPNTALRYE